MIINTCLINPLQSIQDKNILSEKMFINTPKNTLILKSLKSDYALDDLPTLGRVGILCTEQVCSGESNACSGESRNNSEEFFNLLPAEHEVYSSI